MSSAFMKAGDVMSRIDKAVSEWPIDEEHRFKALDLGKEALMVMEELRRSDTVTIDMIRERIGKLQRHFGWQE